MVFGWFDGHFPGFPFLGYLEIMSFANPPWARHLRGQMLYPAVSLRGRAAFNFGPDFKHPAPWMWKVKLDLAWVHWSRKTIESGSMDFLEPRSPKKGGSYGSSPKILTLRKFHPLETNQFHPTYVWSLSGLLKVSFRFPMGNPALNLVGIYGNMCIFLGAPLGKSKHFWIDFSPISYHTRVYIIIITVQY